MAVEAAQTEYASIAYAHQRNKSQTKGHDSEKIHIFDTQINKKFNLISKSNENTFRYKDNSVKEYPEKSRFYSSYIGNVKTLTDNNKIAAEKKEDYQKILQEKIQEMLEKIQKGETEPSYQIGALSFTEKEWDIFLEKFDSLQDAIKELVKAEQEKKEAEQEKKEQLEEIIAEKDSNVLVSEFITYTCPSKNPNDKNTLYITWYTKEGVFCRKSGQTEGYEWSIPFKNKGQYDKVINFINQFSPDQDLKFAANETFWINFLNDEIDINNFNYLID